jgi:hypothetical protein
MLADIMNKYCLLSSRIELEGYSLSQNDLKIDEDDTKICSTFKVGTFSDSSPTAYNTIKSVVDDAVAISTRSSSMSQITVEALLVLHICIPTL